MKDASTASAAPSRPAEVHGVGIGLRMPFAAELLERAPDQVRWLEVHPENYVRRGGRYPAVLDACRARWPVVTHGLTMGFGAVEPFDRAYMSDLRAFLDRLDTPWHSDHLCFAAVDGLFVHDLIPLPFDAETLAVAVARIGEMRDALERPIAVENVSYYAHHDRGHRDEAGFLLDVLERADARLLLDVNNVYVNARNHHFDAAAFIDRMPPDRVVQIHVAGHLVRDDGLRIDTHGESVCDDVYALLEHTLAHVGPKPVLLERDGNFPTFDALLEEVSRLDAIWQRAAARARP